MIEQILKSSGGLNSSEITVYLQLLKLKVVTPLIVSRETKLSRTNCYNILKKLHSDGLIEETKIEGKIAYQSNHPSQMIRLLEKRSSLLQGIMPALELLGSENAAKPAISYIEGLKETASLFESILRTKGMIFIGDIKKHLKIYGRSGIIIPNKATNESQVLIEPSVKMEVSIILWEKRITFLSNRLPLYSLTIANPNIFNAVAALINVSRET